MEDHSAPTVPDCTVTTQSSTAHEYTNQLSTEYHNIECNSQNVVVVEIEPQPPEIQDRPAPALPSYNRFTAHQSTTQSSTTNPSATHSSPSQCPQARDSEDYLIPMPERTESATSIYSYVYEHMVARIMAFVSLQRRGGLVTTSARVFYPYFQGFIGGRSLLVVYVFTSPDSPRGPRWNEGHRPKVRHETSVLEVPAQEQRKHSFCSSTTNIFIPYPLYTIHGYCTSPGAPDLRARLG